MTAVTKTKNNELTQVLEKVSNSITATSLQSGNFKALQIRKVAEALDRPNIAMLKRTIDPMLPELYLSSLITELREWVTVDDRLKYSAAQIPIIAEMLIEQYPVETLEDFQLCFKRGSTGYYGSIFRLDAAVINDWVQKYLDEKYQLIESGYQKEKKKHETFKQEEWSPETVKLLKTFTMSLNKVWVPNGDHEKRYKKRLEWLHEFHDEEYRPLDNWMPFEEYFNSHI